ncbi:hypothetical protein GIB67_019473, partial [Kingdonia uniflora]
MAAMDPEQLDAEYYEHTFALSILLKGAQVFGKEEPGVRGSYNERTEEAGAAVELVTKYSELVAHDDVMSKSVEALKMERNHLIQSYYDFGLRPADVELGRVGRYKEIKFPSEVMADADSERGLNEAYVELLKERGVVLNPARVMFLAQEARNHHSLEARKCSAQA